MSRHLKYLLVILLALPLVAHAGKIYKITDKNGKVIFTDKKPGSDVRYEELTIRTPNTSTSTTPGSRAQKPSATGQQQNPGYDSIRISTPTQDQTIPPGQQEVRVKLALTPGLRGGHLVQLVFDGQPTDKPGRSTSFILTELQRGSHQIQLQVLDADGKLIGSSNTVTIHVKRPSVQNTGITFPGSDKGQPVAAGAQVPSPFSFEAMRKRAQKK